MLAGNLRVTALVVSKRPFIEIAYFWHMKLSHLSETLIGSEIVKLGGEIREKIRLGEKIYNFTVGDFDPQIFPIPQELEDEMG